MTAGPVVFYSADLDVTDWAARHERGEVPDRWPYGLDRIPGATPAPARADSWRLHERVLRKLDGRYDWRARAPRGTPAACWDERTGVPVALSKRDAPVATGVLWLTDQPAGGASARLTRRALDRADALWVNSEAQLEPLRREWRQPESRTHHFPMGIDERFWTPAPDGAPPAHRDTVLVVGNDRDRDHPAALRAIERARRSRPQLQVSLVTHQPVDVPAGLGTRTAGVAHRDLVGHYRNAGVVALAMRHNLHCSGTTAVLEAMACARPVVVTATPGMSDYVQDGVTGFLVPPGDDAAMAEAILTLTADPDAADRMGRAAREVVARRFTTTLLAERIAALLDGA